MTKEPLDLDLNEISKSEAATPPPPVAPEIQKTEVKPLNINIALEIFDGSGGGPRLILKDLGDLTGEEFLLWSKRVFPVLDHKDTNPRHYDNRSQKATAFEHILKFHTHSIFRVKKEIGVA